MTPLQPRSDPEGFYALLGVPASAPQDAIALAFRQKARLLHPDVPGTGNTAAFVAIRQAYDVVGNPSRRAAYDLAARRAALETLEVGEIEPGPPLTMAPAPMRHPRLSDLPIGLWIGAVLVICVGVVEAALHLSADVARGDAALAAAGPVITRAAPSRPDTPNSPPPGGSAGASPSSMPPVQMAPLQLAGAPNYYIVPAAGATVLWRLDPDRRAFVPTGRLPAFTSVQGVRLYRQNGLVEIRVTETTTGLVEASRLAPGDAAAARRAYCAYNSGALPDNGEVLERHGAGAGTLDVDNRTAQPVVVKLRDPGGTVAASVFLAPGGHTRLTGLPAGRYRPDYAIGEMWSRACNSFAAGMRAQRFADAVPLNTLSPLAIPPDATGSSAPPQDISDRMFEDD
jgi:hypothetical protein